MFPNNKVLFKADLFLLQNENTRSEIEDLVKENNVVELKKRLMTRMEFGTAGEITIATTTAQSQCKDHFSRYRDSHYDLNVKTIFPDIGIHFMKIRTSWDHLIFKWESLYW